MSRLETPGSRPLRPHLFTALLISLLCHGLFLAASQVWRHQPRPAPRLTVALPPLPSTEETPSDSEPLLKNTLEASPVEEPKPLPPPAAPAKAQPQPLPTPVAAPSKNPLQAAQRKIAQHVYYPPQAVAAGLEGEVRLLLTLDGKGRIVDADIAASSGHALLDQAALRAAWAMASLEGTDKREMILPVVFRLR